KSALIRIMVLNVPVPREVLCVRPAASVVCAAFLPLAAPAGGADPADLVLRNGRVVTVEKDNRVFEAMAVRGERVAAVGSNAEMDDLVGPGTTLVDLEGRMVLPGLIDSHTHPVGAAMIEFDHAIPEMRTIADVLAHVEARAAALPEDGWIVLQQVFITRLAEQRYPTRAELDRAAPGHRVVFRTGPDASLNSKALAHFGIDRAYQAPAGSKVERDPGTGEPTGILRGSGGMIEIPSEPGQPEEPARLGRVRSLFADYNAAGITAVSDRNASGDAARLYGELRDRGELTVRVFLSRGVGNAGGSDEIRERIRAVADEPLAREGTPMLRTIGIKMFLDGGMLTGSAFMSQPWGTSRAYGISDPAYRGLRFIPPDALEAAVDEAVANGLQFTAHSVGDGAVDALLDAYEAVAARRPIRHTRPNITHCNFMSAAAIARMAHLGVSADIQPAWLYLDGRTLLGHFGEDRLAFFQPLRDLFAAGVMAGGGSDHMQKIGRLRSINPYDPFLGMWTTLARLPRGLDKPLHPAQALDRPDAIRFYTANNAWLLFMEKEIGSLEPGKFADFVVLDRNLLECPLADIPRTRVLETWLAGRRVYQADQGGL
ncbi:MAG TPA: amidohydrolase, partial [Longimicrobiaceae bacterium]|nr:amidohydrolase [Longimicrobiaceae bacterium]